MVAALQCKHPHHEDAPSDAAPLTPYDTRIDQTQAGLEDGDGLNRFVPICHHEAFIPRRRLTAAQRKEMQIKQAALRLAAGLEPRTLREIAREIGCHHNAVDKALSKVCERLGLYKFLRKRSA